MPVLTYLPDESRCRLKSHTSWDLMLLLVGRSTVGRGTGWCPCLPEPLPWIGSGRPPFRPSSGRVPDPPYPVQDRGEPRSVVGVPPVELLRQHTRPVSPDALLFYQPVLFFYPYFLQLTLWPPRPRDTRHRIGRNKTK